MFVIRYTQACKLERNALMPGQLLYRIKNVLQRNLCPLSFLSFVDAHVPEGHTKEDLC